VLPFANVFSKYSDKCISSKNEHAWRLDKRKALACMAYATIYTTGGPVDILGFTRCLGDSVTGAVWVMRWQMVAQTAFNKHGN